MVQCPSILTVVICPSILTVVQCPSILTAVQQASILAMVEYCDAEAYARFTELVYASCGGVAFHVFFFPCQ